MAYFDDIQLVRDSLETGLSASDFTDSTDSTADTQDTDTQSIEQSEDSAPEFAELTDR